MQVTRSSLTTLEEVLSNTPPRMIAMFRVTTIRSDADDSILGEHVYVKNGKIWDFIDDLAIGPVNEYGLHFISYIDR